MRKGNSNIGTRSVRSALAILESFDATRRSQSLSEISRRLALPKATAFRILAALEARGYVVRDGEAKAYSLGIKVWTLAQRCLASVEAVVVARPLLADLAAQTGETAHFSVMEKDEVVYVEMADGPQRIRAYVGRGERLAAHSVASGKAILAYSEPAVVDAVVKEHMKKFTARTLVSRKAFLSELGATRRRGFACNLGEWMEDVGAVSAPVFNQQGRVIAAIGISGPLSRFGPEALADLGTTVQRFAGKVSSLLGAASPAVK